MDTGIHRIKQLFQVNQVCHPDFLDTVITPITKKTKLRLQQVNNLRLPNTNCLSDHKSLGSPSSSDSTSLQMFLLLRNLHSHFLWFNRVESSDWHHAVRLHVWLTMLSVEFDYFTSLLCFAPNNLCRLIKYLITVTE